MEGALTVDSGLVSLNKANTIGGVVLDGGTLAVGNAGALGIGTVTQSGGELLGTANETLTNAISLSGTSIIAAAHGTTLTEKMSSYNIAANSTLIFGAPGQDGTVVWDGTVGELNTPLPIEVQAGTFKGGNAAFGSFLEGSPIGIATGATLDLTGTSSTFTDLTGGGSLIDSGEAEPLTLDAADFSGTISGPLSLVVAGTVTLSGKNTYTGTTTIQSGVTLVLFGGTTGGGAIVDGGVIDIASDNALTLANAISGSGTLQQLGNGVTSINTANTYTGGTSILAGTLAIGNGGALGTGTVTQEGGELLATANETLTNALSLSGTSTIAAAHGKTLTETGLTSISPNSTLNFGAAGQDGVVVWHPTETETRTPFTFNVVAGTLKAASTLLDSAIIDGGQPTTVDAGATLDLGGFDLDLTALLGAGTVTNSGAAATLTLAGAVFSGTISGALSLAFEGSASLSGLDDITGGATLDGAITITNAGTYDLVANTNITGSAGSSFINDKIFEKTGGGVSDVTSNFVNNGTLNVLSGSVQFTGGFTNHGVIHGRVTQSGGVTTVSAPVPSDFNENGVSDILWQNTTSGQASVWDMNANALTGGGPVNPNPGPSFTEVGSGDFNGDGHADILWQNANGQASIWEMDGNTPNGGGAVSPNPGPSWKAIGTGDFNGDGLSDILFQNTSSGQASIWEIDGNKLIGGGPVSPNPGPAWKAVGTGDFNGDGDSAFFFKTPAAARSRSGKCAGII
jgi:autotransporter-associated beta strand protein